MALTPTLKPLSLSGKTAYILLLPFLLLFFRGLADATVLLTAISFLWHSKKTGDWRWARNDWFVVSLITWAYLIFISGPLGYNPSASALYSVAYLRWPVFAAALAFWVFSDASALKLFGQAMLATVLFIMFDTFWQLYNGTDLFGIEKFATFRLTGPMRSPIPGALTLRFFFIALLALNASRWLKKPSLQLSMSSGFFLLALLFTFSTGERMSFLLAIASSVFILPALSLAYPKYTKRLIYSLFVGLLFFALLSFLQPEIYHRAVTSFIASLQNFSSDPYGKVFSTAVELWKEYPLTGVGLHNYSEACLNMIGDNVFDSCQRHPHNIYLGWLTQAGLMGLLLFTLTVIMICRHSLWMPANSQQWILMGCVSATLFVIFWPIGSASSFFNNWFGAVIWCSVGWALATRRITETSPS